MTKFIFALLLVTSTAFADPWYGGNPCNSDQPLIQSASGVTSGNSATQIIASATNQTIWICSLNLQGVSGTNPTFSLIYGTGSNCATGVTAITPPFITPANTLLPLARPVVNIPSGKALCYLDGGTNPVQNFMMTYIQK